jgi:hypothetical protein
MGSPRADAVLAVVDNFCIIGRDAKEARCESGWEDDACAEGSQGDACAKDCGENDACSEDEAGEGKFGSGRGER